MKSSNSNSKKSVNGNNDVRYFNIHTEAMGYLNSLEFIPTNEGGFDKVQFCMLEGNPNEPEKIYVSVIVKNDGALQVLQEFADAINQREIPVFAGLRLAKLRAQPFEYPRGHEQAGQMGINYSARLIKLMYLKVGDHVVQLSEPSVPTTDFGVPSNAHPVPQPQHPVPQPQHPVQQLQGQQQSVVAPQAGPLFEQPPVVQLSKDDPNFTANKDRLMGMGYRWASGSKLWVLPVVTLNPQDPGFKAQGQQLQVWGFANPMFDGVNWEFPLKPQQQSREAQQGYQGNSQNNGHRQGNRGNGNYQGKQQGGYKKQGNGGRNGYQGQKAQNYRQDYQH